MELHTQLKVWGKRLGRIGWLLLFVGITGCLQVKEHLDIHADGSGTLTLRTSSNSAMMLNGFLERDPESAPIWLTYPPLSESSANRLFSGEGLSVDVKREAGADISEIWNIAVSFSNLGDLQKSAYGMIKSMEFRREDDLLSFRCRSGMAPLVCGLFSQGLKSSSQLGPLVMGAAGQKKYFSYRFSVTLPEAPASANGRISSGEVVWEAGAETLETEQKARKWAGTVHTASWTLAESKPDVNRELRIDLDPFDQLTAESVEIGTHKNPGASVAGKAVFIPGELLMSQLFDYTGEGYRDTETVVCLAGELRVPSALKPYRIDPVQTLAVHDAFGEKLSVNPRMAESSPCRNFDEERRAQFSEKDEFAYYPVTLSFVPPVWSENRLSLVSAKTAFYYLSRQEVIKLPQAITADQISPVDDIGMMLGGSYNDNRQSLNGAEAAGLEIYLGQAGACIDVMVICIQTDQGSPLPEQVSIFDQSGTPFTTVSLPVMSYSSDHAIQTYMVFGRPEPPLSLAMVVNRESEPVDIPITLQNLPLTAGNGADVQDVSQADTELSDLDPIPAERSGG